MAESIGPMTNVETALCWKAPRGYGLLLFIQSTEILTLTAEKDTWEPGTVMGRLSWEEFQ